MKIAFVNQPWTFARPNQSNDSIGIITQQLAHGLVASNEVVFYGRLAPAAGKEDLPTDGIRYRGIAPGFLDRLIRPRSVFYHLGVLSRGTPWFASKLFHFDYALKVAKDIRKESFDLAHIQNFSQFAPIIRRLNPRMKLVLHMHCGWLSQIDANVAERRIAASDLVLGCSDYITSQIKRRIPEYSKRCRTLYNSIDHRLFRRRDHRKNDLGNGRKREKVVLFVGRLSPEKGLHVLLEAFQKVRSKFPEVHLRIVGPEIVVNPDMIDPGKSYLSTLQLEPYYRGSYVEHLKRMIDMQHENSISFCGAVDYSNIVHHYAQADFLVNPSVIPESFGMPIIEAMASRLPVIATRIGAFPEIIKDGETGILIAPNQTEDLQRAMLSLLTDERLIESMGKAGSEEAVRKFSFEKSVQTLTTEYSSIR